MILMLASLVGLNRSNDFFFFFKKYINILQYRTEASYRVSYGDDGKKSGKPG